MQPQNQQQEFIQKTQMKQQQKKQEQQINTNYFKSFKQTLITKYGSLNPKQLLQKLIDIQIQNKKLKNRLVDLQPFKQKHLRQPNKKKIQELFQIYLTKKFALKICYLGHLYDGMAMQMQTQNTIQAYLFKCMYTLNLIPSPTPGADYTRAGRTDKGVSAMGNVIALNLKTKIKKKNLQQSLIRENTQITQTLSQKCDKQLNYCQMLNSILPNDIRILAIQQVPQQFNARYWCVKRSYKYFFVKNNLSIQKMKQAVKSFVGKHNFMNFCKMNLCNTVNFERQLMEVNVVKVENNQELGNNQNIQGQNKKDQIKDDRNQVYYFHFVGNSFLWHQIRFMSSVLFMVGQGTEPVSIVKDLLDIQKYPRKPNYTMAPEYPLILEDCLYQNLQFKPSAETTYKFYNTFHDIISKNTIEKTLIINCIHLAKRDFMKNIQLSQQAFTIGVLQTYKKTHKIPKKSMVLHKASGRGIQQAIKSLKGKKKNLYQKKAQKQAQYQAKQKERIQKQIKLI